ncbi:hypothetical protein A2865_04400 [Candidatus Woesebacteria bacterium RIFCSPHIGHO2_01_FULL_39_17]|uniref:Glycosyl hydrolases family 39 N-terminal catalytic domain-containing protein n=3 Tax=Candidatus Woeseibacteriota TaxID=1752722 RepID=A0A0G0QTX6_9BACT|nr:MAG: hypothetical protein US72_C0012G0060 [Microgenomates group bacterium GW2011_GWC1_38_12]KKQ94004.1 MAG: hypothetical protein UT19_C0005G0019 [Candidatus Woesebacteria bacterium GW2011_GWB1_39_10b]KKR13795.1 MAG: hypothetical protein UT40_C0010G0023 [Candidatus Woesebacteria bacterium GW2011_GWA1_39_21b]OGM23398.1 MAG: hypothetical protein A2865_04400 [Candidatus Woesebacteria bacterium RIFCSPHIGHO2_01_FULL_39_17]OGM65163.1 MAG: hypothetical protein A3A52_04695 [Candidatus Woesebacteria b
MLKKYYFRFFTILVITLSLPISLFLLNKKTHFLEKAYFNLSGSEANIVVDLSSARSFTPHWKYLAQGGEERGAMLTPVISKVNNLEPYYIRIDHIYDFYNPVSRDSGGNLSFDWGMLDLQIKTIQATGARPFLSLSYMPEALSRGTEVDLPYSWDEWKLLVQRTIEHVSGNRGLAIAGVYYEVWNEPDLFGGFKLSGPKNYLTLYTYAEKGARDAQDVLPFAFGGPGTTALYKNWFTDFFDYAQKNDLRVDFYSWHRYSKDVNDYERDIENVSSWITRYPKYVNTQFIISESGHNSENDLGYDTNFSAVHTLAMYAATFQKLPIVFLFEIKDGKGQSKNWGRWGILTNDSFGEPEEKPRYRAIEFLNNFDWKYYPVYGTGTWVKAIATKDASGNVVKVLVVNYDPFLNHSENVEITFDNLPFKNFTFRRTDFLGTTSETEVSISGLNWRIEQFFQANSAAMFELIPR